jgi:hypothetical protein
MDEGRCPLPIETLVPEGAGFSREEIEACLALAWLSVIADGKILPEELDAFERAAKRLVGPTADVEGILAQLDRELAAQDDDPWLALKAKALGRPAARDFAYQLAYIMALSDVDTNDDEFHNALRLREVLGLTDAQGEELLDVVLEKMDQPG